MDKKEITEYEAGCLVNKWQTLSEEFKPDDKSNIIVAERNEKNPYVNYYTYDDVDCEKLMEQYKGMPVMWAYLKRELNRLDPLGIKNVNFTVGKPDDERWKMWEEQRLTRGFDDTELWNLDMTILEFIKPRLKAFKEQTDSMPVDSKFKTLDEWRAEIDKMIYWIENKTNDERVIYEKSPKNKEKYEEGKQAFIKYFNFLWW